MSYSDYSIGGHNLVEEQRHRDYWDRLREMREEKSFRRGTLKSDRPAPMLHLSRRKRTHGSRLSKPWKSWPAR